MAAARGVFWQWGANSILYAGVGAVASTLVSAMAGYALAKFRFRGSETLFAAILAGVLVPVSVIPLILMVLLLQRFWRADLLAGARHNLPRRVRRARRSLRPPR